MSQYICLEIRGQLGVDSLLSCPKDQTLLFRHRRRGLCPPSHLTGLLIVLEISYSVPRRESLPKNVYQRFSSWWVPLPERQPFFDSSSFLLRRFPLLKIPAHLAKFYLSHHLAFKCHFLCEVYFHPSSFVFTPLKVLCYFYSQKVSLLSVCWNNV